MAVRRATEVILGISARHVAAGIDPVGHLSLAPAPTGRCRNQPCISRANLIRIISLSSPRHTIRLAETEGLPSPNRCRQAAALRRVPRFGIKDNRHRGQRARRHRDVMKNGLYSIHVTLLDGRVGKGSGVILFRDGRILGGDAYLFYTGSYTVKDDTFKGEVLVQRHTSSPDANPLFGGPNPVGIGVTGTFTDTRATMNGTALVGKASQIFGATLHKLADTN